MNKNLQVGDVFKIRKHSYPCVVTKTAFAGGGTGMGPNDVYPNGHHVTYIQLNKEQYSSLSQGEQINIETSKLYTFYQTGAFDNMISPQEVEFLFKVKTSLNIVKD